MGSIRETKTQHFDPTDRVPILELPEGTLTLSLISRILGRHEREYDPLWRYVRKVDRSLYRGQRNSVRFGKYNMGLRAPNRIPAWIDFKEELLFLGSKLTIPFNAIRGLLVAHGIMPTRNFPIFALMIRVDGCDAYLPLHQSVLNESITEIADFLSSKLRIPLGVASRPLHFMVAPGAAKIEHSHGETPLYEMKSLLTVRDPEGRTRITIMKPGENIVLVDQVDPLAWIEKWGIIAAELVSIMTRRVKSKYGKGERSN
jgi:hypothetical protein